MIRQLVKNGNSKALNLDKTMRDHLGLTSDEVEVILESNKIILRVPTKLREEAEGESFEQAFAATLVEYDEALRNLAK
jgi:antitoxin component of MazEF toxin-antitoxin module